jgi:hypothetical protein
LEGEVEDIGMVQMVVPEGCTMRVLRMVLAIPFLFLKPLMAAGAWALRGKQPDERRTSYVLTIIRPDGGREQARIDGEMLGAMPRRGDYVRLWGGQRHGVLIVTNGYNQTVNGEIRIG